MTTRRVVVATGALQTHARYLRQEGDNIRTIRHILEDGAIPVTAWGVPNARVAPNPRKPNRIEVQAQAPPNLARIKAAYEAAHEAALIRLAQLCSLYASTADGLDIVAENYNRADMRGSEPRYEDDAV